MRVHLLLSHLVKDSLSPPHPLFCVLTFMSVSGPHHECKGSELDRHCSFDLQVNYGQGKSEVKCVGTLYKVYLALIK